MEQELVCSSAVKFYNTYVTYLTECYEHQVSGVWAPCSHKLACETSHAASLYEKKGDQDCLPENCCYQHSSLPFVRFILGHCGMKMGGWWTSWSSSSCAAGVKLQYCMRDTHYSTTTSRGYICHLYLVYLINSFSLHCGVECPVALFIGLCHLCPQDSCQMTPRDELMCVF